MIRVFARKNKWTPTDDLAFYDEPPMFKLPDLPIRVSVTFTWDIERGKRLAQAWAAYSHRVSLGGPAFGDPCDMEFVPGRFIKKGVTFTSRGCPKNCSFCLVHKREGGIRELPIKPGHIIQDNNFLACSQGHILKVFDMLFDQHDIQFKGGLDIDYLETWHVDLIKRLKLSEIWVACDTKAGLKRLDKAADILADFSIEKKRCYVLVGLNGESASDAEKRCEEVYSKGFLPFIQYYQPPKGVRRVVPKEWRYVIWKWSRPAAYRSKQ